MENRLDNNAKKIVKEVHNIKNVLFSKIFHISRISIFFGPDSSDGLERAAVNRKVESSILSRADF